MKKILFFSLFAATSLNFSLSHAAAELDRLEAELHNPAILVKGADEDIPAEANVHFTSFDKTKLFIQLGGNKFRCFMSEGNSWKKCPGIWFIEKSGDHPLMAVWPS
jgi:hypothetical protein